METLMSHTRHSNKSHSSAGFGLLEVIVAIGILTAGLLGLAALMTNLLKVSNQSRYMSTMTMLGSEKLEELGRRSAADPVVWAPDGGTSGSLVADTTQTVAAPGGPQLVDYFDTIQAAAGSGSLFETTSGLDATGKPQYTTVEHKADGTATSVQSANPPPPSSDTLIFNRRWIIEKDPAGLPAGVRRITVWVKFQSNSGIPIPPYQASMVRP
jgi:Tfp pilus assembly protein PilV